MSDVITYTHFRGEILEELSHERLIEIARDLIWESERLRQTLAAVDHALCVHGKIDADADLHKRTREALQ